MVLNFAAATLYIHIASVVLVLYSYILQYL